MNKTTSLHIWLTLLGTVIAPILPSCGSTISTPIPSPSPSYTHYAPSKESNIYLEFDYPSSWIISEERRQYTDLTIIGLGEPQLLEVPTRAPDEAHGTPSDFGRISIWIQPIRFDQTIDTLIEPYKQGHSGASWITALNEYKVEMGGHDVIVLEYQIKPLYEYNGYTSLMFERDMFFVVNNQMYQIAFIVAENDRGGEFEQGYEYFIKSLKIVP